MTYEHASSPLPALFQLPSGRADGEHERGSLSRGSTASSAHLPTPLSDVTLGSTASSTHLMSPLSDLTETVNAITEGYAPNLFGETDWSAYPSLTSSTAASASFNDYPDHTYHKGQTATGSDKSQGAERPGAYDGSSFAMPQYDMFNGAHIEAKVDTQTHDHVGESPFAHMPTHLLQQYLINAGALQQNQTSCGLGLSQAGPTAETDQTLFQNLGAIDTNAMTGDHQRHDRSPSPLFEMDDHDEDDADIQDEMLVDVDSSPSSDLETLRKQRPSRRASEGSVAGPSTKTASTRRMSVHMPMEEKRLRAQATEGLSKQDKRRMQNKLAQRAFRARSKVANRHVFSRLEHLEDLTEQQADRIVKLTELVGRLQKENTGLKTAKFEAAMQAAAPPPQQQRM